MLHQFTEPDAIILGACILFVVTSDCWGVVWMPFLLDGTMLLLQSHLQSHLQPIVGNALRFESVNLNA